MALIIPAGTTAAVSDAFTLSGSESKFVALAPVSGGYLGGTEVAEIQYQANGEYETIGYVRGWPVAERATVIQAPGTYRVRRPVQAHPVGVEAV